MAARLSAADAQRLNTWIIALAETYLHAPAYADQGDERVYDTGAGLALQINRVSGAWYSFSLGDGGWEAFDLLRYLCRGNEVEAYEYATAWLRAHDGLGEQRGHDDDDADETHVTRRLIQAARARGVLAGQVDIVAGDPADVYLDSRRLHRRPEDGLLGFLRDARAGEHALIAKLSDKGRITGTLATYIDALDGKSAHEPGRQRFDLEPGRGACFEIKPAGAGKDMVDVVIAEGLEDGLSIYQLGDRPWRIVALPGIACLEHFQVARGTRVLVVADGDDPKSTAARSLQRGIDHLINDCGAEVKLATAALGEDANSYLTGHSSTAPLLALITGATPAKLGPAGEAERLSRLDPLDAAAEVSDVAGRLGIPVADLRKEIARCRRRREKAEHVEKVEAEVEAAAKVIPKDVPWSDPLPPLAELLDACLKEIKRFLWLPTESAYCVLPLWCLHTHFVHHAKIRLSISPRLGLRSETENAGKTTALDVCEALSATAVSAASITSSVIFRLVDKYKVALFVDEAENQGIRNPYGGDLLAILNAGHRRSKAQIWRSEPAPDGSGSWVPTPFNVWGAMAFAYIGELPRTLRSRCITLPLHPAPRTAKLAKWDDGDLGRWVALRRQLTAYAAACESLPRIALPPAMANRLGDNWDPLFRLANLAGKVWLDRITESAKLILEIPDDPPIFIRLLLDIRAAFAELPKPREEGESKWISTRALLDDHLLADAEAGWNEANQGGRINETWLSRRLRKHLNPPSSLRRDQKDRDEAQDPGAKAAEIQRDRARGYAEMQFRAVNAAYLAAFPPPITLSPETHPAHGAPGPDGLGAEPFGPGGAGPGCDIEGKVIEGVGAEVEGELHPEVVSDPPIEEDDIADLDPDVVGIIRMFRVEHPDWSLERVRKNLHIKRSVVERSWRSTTPVPVEPEEGS